MYKYKCVQKLAFGEGRFICATQKTGFFKKDGRLLPLSKIKKYVWREMCAMIGTQKTMKKFIAILMAMLLCMSTAVVAFADGDSTMELEEVKEDNSESSAVQQAPVDYSELELQVAIANGLYEYDYTKESWSVLKEALNIGRQLIEDGGDQKTVSEAATALDTAVDALVRMDYSNLEKALNAVYSKIEENPELHDIWAKLDDALEKSRPMMVNGDQGAVDKAAAEINALLDELDYYSPVGEGSVVIKEVEVEVPPSDDFCNIAGHRVWPILFTFSFVLNIAIVGMMGYILMKKRRRGDDIPLVNYDIDDDIDDMDDFDDFEEDDEIEAEDDEE